ncbi:MAG: L,D-transpeptidase [Gemmatimonadetes bacterium]|nr:L,D-transpeptidase [Gemmatimonadota bacterium]
MALGALAVPGVAGAQSTAPRDTGLIVASMESAVSRPVEKREALAITVDLSDRALLLMDGRRVVRRFPVSIGAASYPTPKGSFRISHMIWNPSWRPPPSGWARGKSYEPPGSPGNPMGRIKIFFRAPDFYIHGTGLTSSLGRPASHGCIRMRNIDAAELGRILMENGGSPRPAEWYQETLAKSETSREVRLSKPVAIRIQE